MLPSLLSKAFPPYLWKVILLCFIVFNTRETNLLTDYYVLPLRKTSRYTTKNKSLHFTVFSADRVLQPHPLSAAIQWDSPVRLWNERLQTALCLYRKRSWVFLCQVKLWQELKWNNLLCVLNLFFFYKDAERFSFSSGFEEGRDRCPYDPAKGFTGLIIGKSKCNLLYSTNHPALCLSLGILFVKASGQ